MKPGGFNNTFHLCSQRDGSYVFIVQRDAPDINWDLGGIVLTPHSHNGPSPLLQLSLPLVASNYNYSLDVPFVSVSLGVTVFFRTN